MAARTVPMSMRMATSVRPPAPTIGATARTSVSLNGDQLQFNNIVLDEFYFSVGDVSLDETTRDVLEGFLKDLVQSLVDQSLNGALPSLPIPSFETPDGSSFMTAASARAVARRTRRSSAVACKPAAMA